MCVYIYIYMYVVDNLAGTGQHAGQVTKGLNLTRCFSDLFDLELDLEKTFVWSRTGRPGRRCMLSGYR